MRFTVRELARAGCTRRAHLPVDGAEHEVRGGLLRPLPARPVLRLQGRAGASATTASAPLLPAGDLSHARRTARPRARGLASSPRATAASSRCWTWRTSCSRSPTRSTSPISARPPARTRRGRSTCRSIDGSITTAARRRADPRGAPARRRYLVSLGACATAGGIQALRNFRDVQGVRVASSTRSPSTSRRSRTSTAIAEHVPVDFELRGCPPNKQQLLEVVSAFLNGRKPNDLAPTASASSASCAATSA